MEIAPSSPPALASGIAPAKRSKANHRRYWWLLNGRVGQFAKKHALIACLVAFASLAGRAALLRFIPIPEPGVQDEFSYLLAADTFASGRLTNPTPPLWTHFETIHELMRPSYQSKYPPAQGLALALGQLVFGHPWFGVWLSVAAMTAAIYWACAGWLPNRWALLGGVIALLKVGMISYWSTSYFGGAVAAGAGALVIGAVPRLRRAPSFGVALALGVGLAGLANSRPLEGALLGLGALGVLIYNRVSWRHLWAPLALVLIPTAAWMLDYNYRVTGNPLDTPYASHHRQYDLATPFFWDDTVYNPQPPVQNAHIREVHRWEYESRATQMTPIMRLYDTYVLSQLYLGIPLSICVAGAFFFIRWWRLRTGPLLAMTLPMTLFLLTLVWVSPHYAAPATAACYIVSVIVLRRLFHVWPVATQWLVAFILLNAVWQYKDPASQWLYDKRDFLAARKSVLQKLEQAPGKKVVLVQYAPGSDVNQEWIYNRADMDRSETIWAHEMGPEKDRELLNYYPDRQFWRLVAYDKARVALTRLGVGVR
jgi:hypothetical protein